MTDDAPPQRPGYVAAEDKARVLTRLRRIEGQVRGLHRMVDDDAYCIDVLTQISAVTAALQRVGLVLLDDHVRHCVVQDVRDGSTDRLDEALAAIERIIRS